MNTSLEKAFDDAMLDIYRRAKNEAGYTATIFFGMLSRRRGVGTARQLINTTAVSDGYTALFERGRLDLTVEAVVIDNEKWHPLFSTDELARARKRLEEYDYFK
jgi:hypothetical protein